MAGLAGGFKPLGPSKIRMDTSNAMSILGFPSSQSFEHTELIEMEQAFMMRIHMIELSSLSAIDEKAPLRKTKNTKKNDARKLNEAFQFLIQKRRKLTGRAMHTNWQLTAGKSNTAGGVIGLMKTGAGSGLMGQLRAMKKSDELSAEQIREQAEKKRLEQEQLRKEQSVKARELAAEIIYGQKRTKTSKTDGQQSDMQTEMNYWLQFALMSKENRDYFIKRHGKRGDNFIKNCKKSKKDKAKRSEIQLPARLKDAEFLLHKNGNHRSISEKSHSYHMPRKSKKHSSRGSRSRLSSERSDGRHYGRKRGKLESVTSETEYDTELSPTSESSSFTQPNKSAQVKSVFGSAATNVCDYDHSQNMANKSTTEKHDLDNRGNEEDLPRQDNIKSKLSFLRRKLSHLNLKPNPDIQ